MSNRLIPTESMIQDRVRYFHPFEQEYLDKFYRYFDISLVTGCWEWNRKIQANGYGIFTYKNKAMGAHRFSYLLYCGEIPKGLMICHTCDNRKCVNPSHLFLGTSQDNVHDMIRKGRHSPPPKFYGESHSRAFSKLQESDVLNILKHKDNRKVGDVSRLAKEYGVGTSTISFILNGRRWKWLSQK